MNCLSISDFFLSNKDCVGKAENVWPKLTQDSSVTDSTFEPVSPWCDTHSNLGLSPFFHNCLSPLMLHKSLIYKYFGWQGKLEDAGPKVKSSFSNSDMQIQPYSFGCEVRGISSETVKKE